MQSAVRTAKGVLYIAYVGKSLIWLAFGSLMVGLAIWLVWPDGASWFWDILAVLIGCQGLSIIVSGLEQFVDANASRRHQNNPQLVQRGRPAERDNNLASSGLRSSRRR